jgi:hypothetical protein
VIPYAPLPSPNRSQSVRNCQKVKFQGSWWGRQNQRFATGGCPYLLIAHCIVGSYPNARQRSQ